MGCLTWHIDEPKAAWVRWLFDTVDATDVSDLSYRKLSLRMEALGAPTATGKAQWTATSVSRLLHNGKYGGFGVNLRSQSAWGSYVSENGEVYEERRMTARPEAEHYAVSPDACPPLIAPDQWQRVQAKVAQLDGAPRSRFGARRADAGRDLLLVGEFIRCRHCNRLMTRYQTRSRVEPYYQCPTASARPDVCKRHTIAARHADPLAVKLLARALTDPAKILELADAARAQEAAAVADQELAAARLASATERLVALTAERGKLTTAISALGALEGMEAQLAALRERLAALDAEVADLDALRAQAASRRAGASDRAAFLRQIFTTRDGIFDFATGVLTLDPDTSHLVIGTTMAPAQAAALLGVAEDEIAALMPIGADRLNDGTTEPTVATRDVVERQLLRLSRDELRAVFRKLQATVVVSRPRSRAERGGKWTPRRTASRFSCCGRSRCVVMAQRQIRRCRTPAPSPGHPHTRWSVGFSLLTLLSHDRSSVVHDHTPACFLIPPRQRQPE